MYHLNPLPAESTLQDNMAASALQTLAPYGYILVRQKAKSKGPRVKKLQVDNLQGLQEEFQNRLEEHLNNTDDGLVEEKPSPEVKWQRLK